jgi:hypothetical protein
VKRKEYNGWTNWYTWNVHLWLSNNQQSYGAVRNLCKSKQFNLSLEKELVELAKSVIPQTEGVDDYDYWHEVNWHEIYNAFNAS